MLCALQGRYKLTIVLEASPGDKDFAALVDGVAVESVGEAAVAARRGAALVAAPPQTALTFPLHAGAARAD